MQNKKFCMNMRKNDNQKKHLAPVTKGVFCVGLLLIYASLFRLILEITAQIPFTAAKAEQFGRWLEYPVAALMLLSASVYLIERVMRENT
jgi:hypothetical protein